MKKIILITLLIFSNSVFADPLHDKIFANFISPFCWEVKTQIFAINLPAMGTFRGANDAIEKFYSDCINKKFSNFIDLNKGLDDVQKACNDSISEYKQSGALQGPASDSNRELAIARAQCNQAVKGARSAVNIALQTSKGACGPREKKAKNNGAATN